MTLLIDTNILLDMVFKRPNCEKVKKLFSLILEKDVLAVITASAVTDLFYIIRKLTHDIDKTYTIMENIFKLVSNYFRMFFAKILSVTDKDIETAFFKKWKDFEDCVQYTTAKHNSVDYLITSNVHDFEETVFPIISVDEGIVLLEH